MKMVVVCALQNLVARSRTNGHALAEAGGILVIQELLLSPNLDVAAQAALLIKFLFSNHTLQEYVSNELNRSSTGQSPCLCSYMHIHEEDREGFQPLSAPSFPLQLSLSFRLYFCLSLSIYLSIWGFWIPGGSGFGEGVVVNGDDKRGSLEDYPSDLRQLQEALHVRSSHPLHPPPGWRTQIR